VQRAVGPDYAQRLRTFVEQQNGHLGALARAAA
jgi:hypothetical protein